MKLWLASDAQSSSGAAPLPPEFMDTHRNSVALGDTDDEVSHAVVARAFANPDQLNATSIQLRGSTRPLSFGSSVWLKSADHVTIVSSYKDVTTYTVGVYNRAEFTQVTIEDLLLADGPDRNSWTVPTWSLLASVQGNSQHGLMALSGIVEQLRAGVSFARPPELLAMAERVVAQLGPRRDENLNEWADRLARDVSNTSD